MAHDKLQAFLLRQGSNPQLSIKQFFTGLILFFVGIALVYLGIEQPVFVQILGIIVIVVAFYFAIKGYVGIASNRIAFFRHQSHLNKEKFKHIK